jgi:hypothetical protein
LGTAFVAGKKRVPKPATGKTTLVTFFVIAFSVVIEKRLKVGDGWILKNSLNPAQCFILALTIVTLFYFEFD